jgi:hypothetical protein
VGGRAYLNLPLYRWPLAPRTRTPLACRLRPARTRRSRFGGFGSVSQSTRAGVIVRKSVLDGCRFEFDLFAHPFPLTNLSGHVIVIFQNKPILKHACFQVDSPAFIVNGWLFCQPLTTYRRCHRKYHQWRTSIQHSFLPCCSFKYRKYFC